MTPPRLLIGYPMLLRFQYGSLRAPCSQLVCLGACYCIRPLVQVLTLPKAPSPLVYCCRLLYHLRGHAAQWNHRCPSPCRVSCLEQVFIRLLVQLLHRFQPYHPSHVLVWDPGKPPVALPHCPAGQPSNRQSYNGSQCVYQVRPWIDVVLGHFS